MSEGAIWPDLPLAAWSETCDTLQLWTQIVGKVRIALTPLLNHWWNSTFFVTARGLVAPAMPYRGRTVDVIFDRTTAQSSRRSSRHRPRRGQASDHAVRLAAMTRVIRCAGSSGSDRSSE